jgi:hypothetical protein
MKTNRQTECGATECRSSLFQPVSFTRKGVNYLGVIIKALNGQRCAIYGDAKTGVCGALIVRDDENNVQVIKDDESARKARAGALLYCDKVVATMLGYMTSGESDERTINTARAIMDHAKETKSFLL